jgi:2-dehydro-3-deoxyglucarate aldolase
MTADRAELKRRLRSGAFAAWTSIGHPSITEIFAASGVDFIGIDIEHSTISLADSQRIIAAAHGAGVACLPRIASHNGEHMKRLCDAGADGLIVPMVSTPAEVQHIVNWSKYPPLGKRSYGVASAQGYGFEFERYAKTWNDVSTLVIQIESIAGVEAVDELIAHPAVDAAMIGPYDLSGSLGIPGQLDDPRVTEACARVVDACRKQGRACGTHLVDPTEDQVAAAFAAGYTFVVLASDVFILWKWGERARRLVALRRPSR